jgi:MFS family permease
VITVAFFVMFGFFFLATQYLQFGRGYSPLLAGVALLPLPIVFVALSPGSAALAARFGAARVIAAGLVIIASGFALLTVVSTSTPYVVLALAFAVLGAGMGVTAAPGTGEIMSAVPLSKAGVGSAVNDTTRELGGALGIAILGSIANSAFRAGIDLSGLGLPAAAQAHGEESVGAAARLASAVPGGDAVQARAADAFAHAFNVASVVSLGLAVVAAALVVWFARPKRDGDVDELVNGFDFDLDMVPVGAANASE